MTALAVFAAFASIAAGAGGVVNLDSGFGGSGVVVTSVGAPGKSMDLARDALAQSDGKLVVVGSVAPSTVDNAGSATWSLIRHNRDGSLDKSFGHGGRVVTAFPRDRKGPPHVNTPKAAVLQRDGKIVVVGSIDISTEEDASIEDPNPEGSPEYEDGVLAVARYRRNGSLDRGFGSNGVFITRVLHSRDGDFNSYAWGVAMQPDGKILVTASAWRLAPTAAGSALLRLTMNGRYDRSFGSGGTVRISGKGFANVNLVRAVAVQRSGRIVIAGNYVGDSEGQSSGRSAWAIAALRSNGVVDRRFGRRGRIIRYFEAGPRTGGGAGVEKLVIDRRDRIIVLGCAYCSQSQPIPRKLQRYALGRFTADGRTDKSFAGVGVTYVDQIGGSITVPSALTVTGDRKVLVGGSRYVSDDGDPSARSYWYLTRYTQGGSRDQRFDALASDMRPEFAGWVVAVAETKDGIYVAGGQQDLFDENSDFMTARITD